ncbi:hypothetical protein [Clostridium sp. OS1-26]|uniref:O-linked N-acetylglucosamine transferase family protein n=1 Tax=Clostridium sp. OS1-26 TaxID=3070681 RepID=UPI0027E04154|nr:hypothetical protein [Clostridium sp. OS1-26]WML35496.1 hypothetical protein RCG18_01700 [Clostridium sp. OS1-26]
MVKEIKILEQDICKNPKDIESMAKLGWKYLFEKEDLEKALYWYKRIVAIVPDYPYANYYIAECYSNLGNVSMARKYFEKAMELKEYSTSAFNNYAHLLSKTGENEKAIYYFEKAIESSENKVNIYGNLLLTLNYDFFLSDSELFFKHLDFGKIIGERKIKFKLKQKSLELNKKLKIGYVSSDFRQHSVMYFIAAPMVAHSKSDFKIYCYSDVIMKDGITKSLKSFADEWRDISEMKDEDVEQLILKDDIDILVDLNGHAGRNRLSVFAKRIAPIQITWIGYPNTTGLKNMDFRITDNYADPQGITDKYYSEKLVRMSKSFLCYSAAECPEIKEEMPCIRNNKITFGCFNNMAKITEDTIKLWCDILKQVDKSVLVVKNTAFLDEEIINSTKERFYKYGIKEEQLEFIERDISVKDHMNRYNDVDIALDTYPYNGTTTTCEAMYMGVPVITLAGERHASRVGVSLLTNVGLDELIAYSEEEYIQKAVDLAGNIEKLKKIKLNLRTNMKSSPLMEGDKFTKELEKVYKNLWIDYCNSEKKKEIKADIVKIIEQGNLQQAKILLNEYEKIAKEDIEIYSIKSVIAIIEGNIALAEKVLQEGINLDKEYYDLLYNMAYVQELKGNEVLAEYYKDKANTTKNR